MYSQSEIQSAIDAGILKAETAEALQNHVSQIRKRPLQDEEHFRLVSNFNDIFVAIATIILLFAAGGIGNAVGDAFTGLLIAATTWVLAEFFTLKRRMALPSIILLLAFSGGVFAGVAELSGFNSNGDGAISLAITAAITAVMTGLHWKRFKVPITIAAGAGILAIMVISFLAAIIGNSVNEDIILPFVLIAGLAIFTFAMWWDISDKARETRRSDVAFWLHLLAAPMIAHPIFHFIGAANGDEINALQAIAALAMYIFMAAIAITIDRRALLVSSLAYVLFALTLLFREFGVIELNVALTAFVIGSALLSLSAFWSPLRRAIVSKIPEIVRNNVPTAH